MGYVMFYHGPQPNDDSRATNHLRVFTININPEKTGYSIYSYIYTLYVIKLFRLGWFMALGLPVKKPQQKHLGASGGRTISGIGVRA